MWLGYITYPDAFLLPEDKATLLASQFIASPPTSVPEPTTAFLVISGFLGVAVGCVRRSRIRVE